MWPESSSLSIVNLEKKLLQFQRYRIFPRGLLIWRDLYTASQQTSISSLFDDSTPQAQHSHFK